MQVTADVDLDLDSSVHPDNAIRVCYTGARASQATTQMLQRAVAELVNARITPTPPLTAKELSDHYRMDDTQTVFFQLPQRVDASAVFGLDGDTAQKINVRIARPDYEDTRVFLNYCPPNLTDQQLAQLARKVMSPEQVKHSTMYKRVQGRRDRHLLIAPLTPEQIEEVPHYIRYKARGLEKTVMITMPGRRPVCPRCEQGVHRYSDCKKKTTPKSETAQKKRRLNSSSTQTENEVAVNTTETQTVSADETIITQSHDLDETFVSQPSAASTPSKKHQAAFEQLSTSGDIKLIVSTEEDVSQRTVIGSVITKTMTVEAIRKPITDPKEPPKFQNMAAYPSDGISIYDIPSGTMLATCEKGSKHKMFFIEVQEHAVYSPIIGEQLDQKFVVQTKDQVLGPCGLYKNYVKDMFPNESFETSSFVIVNP